MMSRSLKPTWPFSSRWIFHSEARMASPASSRDRPVSVRSRRSWAPTSMRRTVGPPNSDWTSVMTPPTARFHTVCHFVLTFRDRTRHRAAFLGAEAAAGLDRDQGLLGALLQLLHGPGVA